MPLRGRVPGLRLQISWHYNFGGLVVHGQNRLPQGLCPASQYLQPALLAAGHGMVDTSQEGVPPKSVEEPRILGWFTVEKEMG